MTFRSTRGGGEVGFREAVFAGLAPDGGLFHPAGWADLGDLFRSFGPRTDFPTLAERTMLRLLAPELSDGQARRIARRAFPFSPRLQPLDSGILLLELFHGPTCAFKDFGASFLACVMDEFLKEESRRAVILVATSGDTGSAVARAFHGKATVDVVVLYPSGRVSPLQEKQLTTVGGNVTALEVLGSFDDCQRLVKEAFLDPALRRRLSLTSANSINLGRLIPQSFYYIYAAAQLAPADGAGPPGARQAAGADRADRGEGSLRFCVPSGNFGNLTAGVYAWKWGLPVAAFIAATNRNDVVPRYLDSGRFSPRASVHTLSNAMDVGNPSNFERLSLVFDGEVSRMRAMIHGEAVSDGQTLQAIRREYERSGLLLDPHTAVGVQAARRFLEGAPAGGRPPSPPAGPSDRLPVVVLATAHPAKFGEIVREATGAEPPVPASLREAMERPKQSIRLENRFAALSGFLLERFA